MIFGFVFPLSRLAPAATQSPDQHPQFNADNLSCHDPCYSGEDNARNHAWYRHRFEPSILAANLRAAMVNTYGVEDAVSETDETISSKPVENEEYILLEHTPLEDRLNVNGCTERSSPFFSPTPSPSSSLMAEMENDSDISVEEINTFLARFNNTTLFPPLEESLTSILALQRSLSPLRPLLPYDLDDCSMYANHEAQTKMCMSTSNLWSSGMLTAPSPGPMSNSSGSGSRYVKNVGCWVEEEGMLNSDGLPQRRNAGVFQPLPLLPLV